MCWSPHVVYIVCILCLQLSYHVISPITRCTFLVIITTASCAQPAVKSQFKSSGFNLGKYSSKNTQCTLKFALAQYLHILILTSGDTLIIDFPIFGSGRTFQLSCIHIIVDTVSSPRVHRGHPGEVDVCTTHRGYP